MVKKRIWKQITAIMSLMICINIMTGCEMGTSVVNEDGTLTIDVYSQPADRIGEQNGWFGREVSDRFGLRLNYLSSGENDYMLYSSQEELGDLIIFDNISNFREASQAGLLFEWNDEELLAQHGSSLMEQYPQALKRSRLLVEDGKLYGIGSEIAAVPGIEGNFLCVPQIRWDLYEQIDTPVINTLSDYIPVLKQMQELYPETEKGKKVYGVSLFKDWDDGMLYFADLIAGLYGYEKMGLGYYIPKTQEWESCLADEGMYITCLRFYHELYMQGLLDPDSINQDYSMALTKYQQGTVLLSLIDYLGSTIYNNWSNLSEGRALCTLVPNDSVNLRYEESIYGNDCIWAIGADCIDPEDCMELISWLFSKEGNLTMLYGPENVTWNYDDNQKAQLTEFGQTCLQNNLTLMPDSNTSFLDGMPLFNVSTLAYDASMTILPEQMEYQQSDTTGSEVLQSWRQHMNADTTSEYLSSMPYVLIPATTFELSERSDQLDFIWVQIQNCIQEYSWKAVYTKNDEEFDQTIQTMQEKSEAYGFADCESWCRQEADRRAKLENR